MASIPLPALAVKAPEQADVLGQLSKLQALRSMSQQYQLQQQAQQENQLKIQQQQQQVKDQQTVMQALGETNGDMGKAIPLLAGKVSPTTLEGLQKFDTEHRKALSDQTKADNEAAADRGGKLAALTAQAGQLPDDQYAQMWPQIAAQAVEIEPKLKGHINPGQPIPKDQLANLQIGFLTQAQYHAQAAEQRTEQMQPLIVDKTKAETAKDAAQAALAQTQESQAGQVTPKDKYVQAQENYRATLARQATTANQRQNQGITALQKQSDDYSKVLSSASTLKNSLQAAQDGNEMAAAVAPLQGTLFITTTEGVKRINQTELAGVEGAGSLIQRINGALGKQTGGGPLSQSLKDDMAKLIDIYTATKFKNYQNQANYTKKLHGLGDETPLLDQKGNIAGAPGSGSYFDQYPTH